MIYPMQVGLQPQTRRWTSLQRFIITTCLLTIAVASALGFLAGDSWVLSLPVIGTAALIIIGVHLGRSGSRDVQAVSALDIFLAITYLHGCLVPLIDMVAGPPELNYRGHSSLQGALVASCLSLAFTAATLLGWTLQRPLPPGGKVASDPFPINLAWLFIGLGLTGLTIRAPQAIAAIRGTLTPGLGADGLFALMGTLATPLLPVGSFLLLASLATRRRPRLMAACLLVPLSVVAVFSYSLNRAAIIIPAVAMILTWVALNQSKGVGRKLVALTLAGAVLFIFVGQWRNDIQLRSVGITSTQREAPLDYAVSSLRAYGQSAYLVGILYDTPQSEKYSASSAIASALGPIPSLGRPFRDNSGALLYNYDIYAGASNDQILPVWAEFERSFGASGMLLLGAAIGMLLRRIDDRMSNARDAPRLYAWTLGALWLGQVSIVSVAILAQIAIYFILPLALIVKLRSLTEPEAKRRPAYLRAAKRYRQSLQEH